MVNSPKRKKKSKKSKTRSYINKRGYNIIKSRFSFKELHKCKKDLTVAPFVNESVAGKPNPFPVYLESMKKLYVPRHYGIEHFGEPDKVKIKNCYDINLQFKGKLRKNQLEPVNAFLKSCENSSLDAKKKIIRDKLSNL